MNDEFTHGIVNLVSGGKAGLADVDIFVDADDETAHNSLLSAHTMPVSRRISDTRESF